MRILINSVSVDHVARDCEVFNQVNRVRYKSVEESTYPTRAEVESQVREMIKTVNSVKPRREEAVFAAAVGEKTATGPVWNNNCMNCNQPGHMMSKCPCPRAKCPKRGYFHTEMFCAQASEPPVAQESTDQEGKSSRQVGQQEERARTGERYCDSQQGCDAVSGGMLVFNAWHSCQVACPVHTHILQFYAIQK
jgi:hypothetical protein